MTPGVVNGVRCVWPEVKHEAPAPAQVPAVDRRTGREQAKPCLNGHMAGRYTNGECIVCHRDRMRVSQRAAAAAKRAAKDPA